MKIYKKSINLSIIILAMFLLFSQGYGQTIMERYRLGSFIENSTYVTTGPLQNQIVFIDGFNIYNYNTYMDKSQKLCQIVDPEITAVPRGICYLEGDIHAGSFLINNIAKRDTLYIISIGGDIVSKPALTNFPPLIHMEGMTAISSGPFAGMYAMIGFPNWDHPHIYIFQLINNGENITAILEKDISASNLSDMAVGISFIPQDHTFTAYQNKFIISDYQSSGENAVQHLRIIDEEGNIVEEFIVDHHYEGVSYFSDGPYKGKIIVSDITGKACAIMDINGNNATPANIWTGVGLGLNIMGVTWEPEGQKFLFLQRVFDTNPPESVIHLISRHELDSWRIDQSKEYFDMGLVRDITFNSAEQLIYLNGYEGDYSPDISTKTPYIHGTDLTLALKTTFQLPEHFSLMCHIPPHEGIPEMVAMISQTYSERKSVYLFDKTLSTYQTIDLSSYLSNVIRDISFDPNNQQYFILDGTNLIHIFDTGWNIFASIDVGSLAPAGFTCLTNISSGLYKGDLGLFDQSNMAIVIVRISGEVIPHFFQTLIKTIQTSTIPANLQKNLLRLLEKCLAAIENEDYSTAIKQLESFIKKVETMRWKKIDDDTATKLIRLAQQIIDALAA